MADNPQQGLLTYNPGSGVTLSLVGGFDDRERFQTSTTGYIVQRGSVNFGVIHGAVGGGKLYDFA